AILLHLWIAYVCRDGIAATCNAIRVNLGCVVLARDLAAGGAPAISKSVFRIEAGGIYGSRDWLPDHHLARLHRAARGWRSAGREPEIPQQSGSQACPVEDRPTKVRELWTSIIGKVVSRHYVVGFEYPQAQIFPYAEIDAAPQDRADSITGI